MQGLVFEPAGYFDDKLKRRAKKKRGDLPNPSKLQRKHSSKSAHSTPTGVHIKRIHHYHQRSNSSTQLLNKSCSNLVDTLNPMYQPTSLQTSLSHTHSPSGSHSSHHKHKHKHKHKRKHSNGRKRSGSGSSVSSHKSNHNHKSHKSNHTTPKLIDMPSDDILEAYRRRLKRKKLHRTRSLNSNGATALLKVERERITKDKFSRLFHDFDTTKSMIDRSQRDQLFRNQLAKLNEKKQKNKADAYELIRQYFTSILDKKYSNHPLAKLIEKFCNWFHAQYSFSPQDFKNKSIYQIVDQKRLKRKGNKRSTSDIFDDSVSGARNQSKVVRKTSRRLDRATDDVKNYINKLRALILTLYTELKALRTYKYVVQSVFHKELFQQLTPTLGDLYSIKTEDKQSEFAKYMGMWHNLSCKDFGASEQFIEFCLIPSLRPPLLTDVDTEQKEGHTNEINNDTMETANGTKQNSIENEIEANDESIAEQKQTEAAMITESKHDSNVDEFEPSGLSKQLILQTHVMSNYSQLNGIDGNEEDEEKQSEIIHNAEPAYDDITNNILTEQTLKEFDDNYAISQLLNDKDTTLGVNNNTALNNNNINTNFTIPEFVNEYNMELDYDDDSFHDIVSSGGSSQYYRTPTNLSNYNARARERELNNILNVLSPTISSASSMDGVSDQSDIHSSPDSSIANSELTYQSKVNDHDGIISIYNKNNMNKKKADIPMKLIVDKTVDEDKPRSRISSFFGAFSSKKSKKQRKNTTEVDLNKIGIINGRGMVRKYDKYETMNAATKLIEQGIQQRKTPQQFLKPNVNINNNRNHSRNRNRNRTKSPIINIKTPKISITPQNEHQENHPTPPNKRMNIKICKVNNNKIQFKDNINNITKQMLAGSHAGRIADQLHRRATGNVNVNVNTSINTINCKPINVNANTNVNVNTNIKSINDITDHKEIKTETNNAIEKENENQNKKEEKESEFIETEEDRQHNPYMPAVLEMRKMPSYDTPEDKIQCVVRTADIIRDCIDKYYEARRKKPVQITPDDLLSLFAYILTQANLHCLWAEVDLIDDFVVDNLRMDMPGYYIATLRAAMQLIVNDIEKLTATSTKKRNSNCFINNLQV